jgi:hypothetical protein
MAGGGAPCESTDECLNTVVNALSSVGRTMNGYSCPPHTAQQIGDFSAFRTGPGIRRYVVLVTDAPPSGFCDKDEATYDPLVDGQRAFGFAQQAGSHCMRINAIQVDTAEGVDVYAAPVMSGYAQYSCGWYSQVPHNATGLTEAVVKMLYSAGACTCQ